MKKNGKRLGALLLALVMVVSLVPVTALAARVEDDAVPMIAPDTNLDVAKPAGAVDAVEVEDIPAVLAEGESQVLFGDSARGEIYISGSRGDNGGVGTDATAVKNTIYTADGSPWIGSDMKDTSTTNVYDDQKSWIVLDLNASVKTVTEVTIQFNAKAWATNYLIQVAGADLTPNTYSGTTAAKDATDDRFTGDNAPDSDKWTTIYTMDRNNGDTTNPTDTISATENGFTTNNNTDSLTTTVPDGTRYLRIYFTGINPNAQAANSVNVKHIEVKGTGDPLPAEQPPYTLANINAGLFDVGANPTKSGGTWSANYSNPGNSVITATAPSYRNDGPPSNMVDGDTTTRWHSNWGSDEGEGSTNMTNSPEIRYIQLDLSAATEISALRYLPFNWGDYISGVVTRYRVEVCADDTVSDSSTWTAVATADGTTNWDAAATSANGSGDNWYIAYFNEAVTVKHVRLYGAVTKNDGRSDGFYMTGREIRLVEGALPEIPVTGTITTDGTTALAGAKVELVQDNATKTLVRSVAAATTDENGAYQLNLLPLVAAAAGNYKIRVSKAGYGAVIGETTITVTADNVTAGNANNNATLTAIDVASAKYGWSFDDESSKPANDALTLGSGAQKSFENGTMKLTWADSARANNLVRINKTNAKNCVVEFDATRLSGTNRFGLGVRIHGDEGSEYWVYVGQFNNDHEWGAELFKGTTSGGWSAGQNNISFNNGETRHFKVTLEDGNVTLEIDGIKVINNQTLDTFCNSANSRNSGLVPTAEVLTAGDVGFLYGNTAGGGACNVAIDNLYVFRNDPANRVSWTNPEGETIIAKYTENGEEVDIPNGTGDGVPSGVTVTITGTSTDSKVLDAITVKKVGDGGSTTDLTTEEKAELNITNVSESVFTFTMPAFSVDVEGTFLPKVTGVTIDETNGLKVGKTLTATVTPADADGKVTYQWYHLNNEGQEGEAWVACTNEGNNTKTKTVSAEDQGKKVKVVVTGNGTDYAATVTETAISSGVMAAADVETSSVVITRDQITMWKNCDTNPNPSDNTQEGKTTTVTATVSPTNATNKTITWTSSDTSIATVTANADNVSATVTAVANGTATIKAEVTSANGTKVSDTVTVTVKTKVESITVKNGETVVTESAPAKVYLNDGDATAPRTITLVGTLTPSGASDKGLSWALADGSATGKINIQPVGATAGDPDSAESSGNGVTIAAVGTSARNVGEVTVTVTAHDEMGATTSFKVQVWRKLAHDVTITGTPKFGETLEVNTSSLDMAQADKDKLTYQWKRNGTNIDGATSSTYTLVEADIGATISVEVTAGADTFYEGTKSATTATVVAKADAPAAPTGLNTTDCTTDDNNDGTITGLTVNTTYDVSKMGDDGNWGAAESKTADASGVITGLTPGDYRVRVPETNTTKPGAYSTSLTIQENGANAKPITVATGIEHGNVSTVRSKVDAGETVTVTVEPDEGYQLKAGTLTVTPASGGAAVAVTAGSEENTWTFTMPDDGVTITAQFELTKVRITHVLTNLDCDHQVEHDEDGNSLVDYGTVTEITLTPDTGYELPESITVTYTDGTEAPTTRCSYNNETGVITFPQGVQRNITITAAGVKKTYTVSLTATGNRLDLSNDETEVEHGNTFTGTLSVLSSAAAQYELPATLTSVTMDGTALTAGTGYTYDSTSGAISIPNVTGTVVITATAVRKTIPVESVSITIHHQDETVTSDIPHVGDTLDTTVTPSGAKVTYAWLRDGATISGAVGSSYKLTNDDLGKQISVKVTGNDTHSGEQTSTATKAVEVNTIAATGISLDRSSASVEFGKTLTLIATVTPEEATDKTVTWTSSNPAVATVAGGVVTPVGLGTTTITATNSAGQDNTCIVTVAAAPVGVKLSGVAKVGETLTATVTPAGATLRSINWYRVSDVGAVDSLDNTGTTYTLVAADAGYQIRVSIEGTGNYTGTAQAITSSKVVGNGEELPTNSITISDSENGTVTADKETAAEGELVTLTVTPTAGYVLDTLTVSGDSGEVEVAEDNTFVMPAEAVTITATFTKIEVTGVTLNKTSASVRVDSTTKLTATLTPASAAGEVIWASDNEEVATVDADGTVHGVAEGTANITVTVDGTEFSATCSVTVTKKASSSSSRPSTTTSTVTNEDGSTTTTVTKPDGTKTETTEKPDGTKETVETKRDGTVIETTEKPDGTKETVKTQPDGTVVEIVVTPDGTKESVATKPDGTVTETVIDPEGAMTEKVTDPEENVVITVTDAEGEELAKLELPATVAEPETKFEDIEGHWAEDSINKVTALGLVNGVGDNKYGTESSLTRGALATVLYRLSHGKNGYRVTFSDVEIGKYYTEGVAWAAKAKVVTGYTAEIFAPNDTITREQLAVMMARYAKLIGMDTKASTTSLDKFTDGNSTGAWAVDGVAWCVENGILQGKGANILDPTANVTRAQVAVMLDRFIELIK